MTWDLDSDRPIYTQLIEQIKLKICSGVYKPGARLPSVRDLAQEVAVNPNTMQRALAKLEEEGLLYTHRTSGKYVTEEEGMIKQVKDKLAREQVQAFLDRMLNLGFSREELLSVITKMMEEVK